LAEDERRSKRQASEAEVEDVWTRVRQKIAINDAYYHFIDTGKLMPLAEASLASPEDSFLLKRAIQMLENHRGYPWVIKRQVEKSKDEKARGRPASPAWEKDKRLTYMKVAIEKHEQMLRWAGEQKKITAAAVISRIWEMEELPPLSLSDLGSSSRYALHKQAKSHVPQDQEWLRDVEMNLYDYDAEFMRQLAKFGDDSSK
jgi:hypothetical protein